MKYGRDFDFNKPFFEQFEEMQKEVPLISLHQANNVNCEYTNYPADCKNCYMIFGSVYSEDCLYGNPYSCRNCVDSLLVRDSELCYDCITCEKCYQCFHSQDCTNSSMMMYCYDCHGCSDCIGCVGLANKKNYIFNKKYTPEEYRKVIATLDLCDKKQTTELKAQFEDLKKKLPHRSMVSLKVENCTGDYIYESKNTSNSYDIQRCWDCSNLAQTIDMKDCEDCNYTEENELCYEYIAYYRNKNTMFSLGCFGSYNAQYSAYCMTCQNVFGCIGLKHKNFCIFNEQYTEDEYKKLVGQIIEYMKKSGEYGEFFPVSISPFCYNETVAQEYFPLTKEEALARGYRWREKDPKEYLPQTFQVPEKIKEVPESILAESLSCIDCGKNFRIQKAELMFLKKLGLPIPTKCPDCRHKDRLALRNPRELFQRTCAKCSTSIQTTYSPNRQETIYCEKCYLESVY
jgi:hypothetical protein